MSDCVAFTAWGSATLPRFSLPINGPAKNDRSAAFTSRRCLPVAVLSPVKPEKALSPSRSPAPGFNSVREMVTPVPIHITGSIPSWLRGELIRVGPSVFEAPARDGSLVQFEHWSDGLPFLHRFTIAADGNVTYMSRHIAKHIERAIASVPTSSDYRAITVGKTKRSRESPFQKVLTMFQPRTTDPTMPEAPEYPVGVVIERNTGIHPMVITTDAPHMLEVDPITLQPGRFITYKDLGVGNADVCCAHGEYDARDNAYYNLLSNVATPKGCIKVVKIKDGKASLLASIPNVPSSYIHSFGMTENYIVVIVGAARVNGLKVLRERSFLAGLRFDSTSDTRVFVIDKKSGAVVANYIAKPCFFFHIVNVFETGDDVAIDICRYQNEKILRCMQLRKIKDLLQDPFPESLLTRFKLKNVRAGHRNHPNRIAFEKTLSYQHLDMPNINSAFKGADYKYVYGVSSNDLKQPLSAITKQNVKTGVLRFADVTVCSTHGCYVSEPIFVPNPHASASTEDDGAVVYIELDVRPPVPRSALVVRDAKTMKEVARCETPRGVVIPFSFHGEFLQK